MIDQNELTAQEAIENFIYTNIKILGLEKGDRINFSVTNSIGEQKEFFQFSIQK